MIGAGLLARKAVERGLHASARRQDQPRARLAGRHRLPAERRRPATTSRRSASTSSATAARPASATAARSSTPIAEAVDENDLVVAAVLSGNRNFEGRIHPQVRASFLASPPLVVAYALAGTVDIDLTQRARSGHDPNGDAPSTSRDIWPRPEEIEDAIAQGRHARPLRREYGSVFDGDERWRDLPVPDGQPLRVGPGLHLHPGAALLHGHRRRTRHAARRHPRRPCSRLRRRLRHDRPHLAGRLDPKDSPAGQYLISRTSSPQDFNCYGSRRGNHEVHDARHLRATSACATSSRPATKATGPSTCRTARRSPASTTPPSATRPRACRSSSSPARSTAPAPRATGPPRARSARRQGRDRRELRAHPPQQPRRHGHPAPAVPARRERRLASA